MISLFSTRCRRALWCAPVLFGSLLAGCGDRGSGAPGTPEDAAPTASWFVDITAQAGLGPSRGPGEVGDYSIQEIMASGAALFDYDNDGDLDVYLTNERQSTGGNATGSPRNRLYRQEGDGRFVDVTSESGLADAGYGVGVAIGDVDNDGDADVYLSRYGPDRLYRNRGDGTFEDATAGAGITVNGWSCSAAFFDYDLDGYLDLYLSRYVENTGDKRCTDNACRPD